METIANEADILSKFSNQLADAVERASGAVVLVNGRERQAASGLVFAKDTVVTAAHVLEREDPEIETHDGKTLQGKLVAHDPRTDLAVLQALRAWASSLRRSPAWAQAGPVCARGWSPAQRPANG